MRHCIPLHDGHSRWLADAGKVLDRILFADNHIIRQYDSVPKTIITVTEAARNFADCVNRSHYQDVTFVLLKNGSPFARLVPDSEKVCLGRDLSEALVDAQLSTDDAKAWRRDVQAVRKTLKPPGDKWR